MQFRSILAHAALAGGLLVAAATTAAADDGDASGFFIAPEALYFTFTESNFNYARVSDTDSPYASGNHYRVDGDYDLGWRLGLGYRWDNDWDFTFRYTHFDSQAEDNVQASGDDYLYADIDPYEEFQAQQNAYAEARSDQSLDYADVEVGRSFKSDNGHFFGRAYFGARWARFDQDLEALYVDNGDTMPFPDTAYTEYSHQTSKYDGWGITVGGEGHIRLGDDSDWSFFGSAGLSVLMGRTKQTFYNAYWNDYQDFPGADPDYLIVDSHDHFNSTATTLEAQLGVEWAHQYDKVKASLRFGWEIQHWSGIGGIIDYADDDSGYPVRADRIGDVGLMGGFVRAGWAW